MGILELKGVCFWCNKSNASSCSKAQDMGGSSTSNGSVSRVQVRWPSFHVKDNVYDYAYR